MRRSCVSVATGCLVVSMVLGQFGCGRPALQNKGSDTMLELAQAWSEAAYKAVGISVEVSGGGTGVGVAALINGTVDIANASRELSEKEIADAKSRTGKEPVKHVVGYDALAIYVHKDNPIEELTVEQLKEIYSEGGKITLWSQLGVKVPGCDSDEIVCVSRQNNSGTYEYFREHVLGKNGKYRLTTIDASGSKDLVTQVGHTPCAIGYSGMGYKTDAVKFVKIKQTADSPAVEPSIRSVHDGTYPISRPLFMYTLGPGTPEAQRYLEWVRSDEGQKILEGIGYVPLKPEERSKPTK